MVTDLVHLQGVIQLLLQSGNTDGAESIVSSYGVRLEHKMLFVTDSEGRILLSTRLETISRNWNEINEPVDPIIVAQVLQTKRYDVQLSRNQENIYGYVNVCVPDQPATLRPIDCGFLFHSRDLKQRKHAVLAAFRNQALLEAVWMGGAIYSTLARFAFCDHPTHQPD